MNGICYIVGAGEFYSHLEKKPGDIVIAADGGYDALLSFGIACDIVIGDMDSIVSLTCDCESIRVPVEKDETDMYLCYLEGVRRGYTSFVVFGGVGGRCDHTFANYSLLIYAKKRGHSIKLIDERFDIFAISGERLELTGHAGHALSVFAFGGEGCGVTISGCKYPADNISLTPDFPLGVSNTVTEELATVEVREGSLLIMLER